MARSRCSTIFYVLMSLSATTIIFCVHSTHRMTYRDQHDYRDYEHLNRPCVKELYRLNHIHQTLNFVLKKKKEYLPPRRKKMGIWQVMELLDNFVDDSDPDLGLSQIHHALQTAEAMRADGHPRWFILMGLIHDLGKMLNFFGEPQWAVVGDTFPVGCAYSTKIVFYNFFSDNPDFINPLYQTKLGIYKKHCGLESVHMSWGHDEYMYHVVKQYLPEQAAYIIRYHSFYPQHQDNAYDYLLNDYDRTMMAWVKLFNQYDLYSKQPERLDVQKLKPYYQRLIRQYFPDQLDW